MFKKLIIVMSIAIALLISSSYWSPDTNFKEIVQKNNNAKRKIYIKDVSLAVDVADELHEQTNGLSRVEYIAENEGMIFIFPGSIIPAFWMKEMNFALDIIWIDAKNIIIGIEKDVWPETFPKIFSPSSPVKYVLEVNAGWSDKNQISLGDKLEFN